MIEEGGDQSVETQSADNNFLHELLTVTVQRILVKAAESRRINDTKLIKRTIHYLVHNQELINRLFGRIGTSQEELDRVIHSSMGPIDFASMQPLQSDGWITVGRCGHWKDSRIESTFSQRYLVCLVTYFFHSV